MYAPLVVSLSSIALLAGIVFWLVLRLSRVEDALQSANYDLRASLQMEHFLRGRLDERRSIACFHQQEAERLREQNELLQIENIVWHLTLRRYTDPGVYHLN